LADQHLQPRRHFEECLFNKRTLEENNNLDEATRAKKKNTNEKERGKNKKKKNSNQKDLNEIWGFTTWPFPPTPPAPAPAMALLIECSNSSLVPASNFPAASLKALGEVVAKERSCAVVWVVIEVAVIDIVGGGGEELSDKRREMVGSKTPNSLDPKQRMPSTFLK
jgi:hypothetical protein